VSDVVAVDDDDAVAEVAVLAVLEGDDVAGANQRPHLYLVSPDERDDSNFLGIVAQNGTL